MEFKKADWLVIKEAEEAGLLVGMHSLVTRYRTELNNELSQYFREKSNNLTYIFEDEEAEEILYTLNTYIQDNNLDIPTLDFPYREDTDIYLIPINPNVQLKLYIGKEYQDGMMVTYITYDFFVITPTTTKKDVDDLIKFITEYFVTPK